MCPFVYWLNGAVTLGDKGRESPCLPWKPIFSNVGTFQHMSSIYTSRKEIIPFLPTPNPLDWEVIALLSGGKESCRSKAYVKACSLSATSKPRKGGCEWNQINVVINASQHEHWPTETIFIHLRGVHFILSLEGGHLINQNLILIFFVVRMKR